MSADIDPMELVRSQSMDANAWAISFMQTKDIHNLELDVDIMRTWFANAIMCCHDNLHNNKISPLEAKLKIAVEALKDISDDMDADTHIPKRKIARTALNKIKGGE